MGWIVAFVGGTSRASGLAFRLRRSLTSTCLSGPLGDPMIDAAGMTGIAGLRELLPVADTAQEFLDEAAQRASTEATLGLSRRSTARSDGRPVTITGSDADTHRLDQPHSRLDQRPCPTMPRPRAHDGHPYCIDRPGGARGAAERTVGRTGRVPGTTYDAPGQRCRVRPPDLAGGAQRTRRDPSGRPGWLGPVDLTAEAEDDLVLAVSEAGQT